MFGGNHAYCQIEDMAKNRALIVFSEFETVESRRSKPVGSCTQGSGRLRRDIHRQESLVHVVKIRRSWRRAHIQNWSRARHDICAKS